MATRVYQDLKWSRVGLARRATLRISDTAPQTQVSPGLLHFLALRVQVALSGGQ